MRQDSRDAAIPLECQDALRAIEGDPINIGPDALEHVSTCRACSEARVLWLAQEDFDHAWTLGHQAPAGYFEALPGRMLRKLPASSAGLQTKRLLLASAASLAMLIAIGIGAGGYLLGRHDQTPVIFLEAVNPPKDFQDLFPDPMSFSSIELFSQIPDLTPEETSALMTDLKKPAKPEDD
jgi:hypothetical protein